MCKLQKTEIAVQTKAKTKRLTDLERSVEGKIVCVENKQLMRNLEVKMKIKFQKIQNWLLQ